MVSTTDTDALPEHPPLRAPHAASPRAAVQRSAQRGRRKAYRRILKRGLVLPSVSTSLAGLRRCLRAKMTLLTGTGSDSCYFTSVIFPIFQERSKKAFVGEYQRK